MNRFAKYLRQKLPGSGRIIREDGSAVNVAGVVDPFMHVQTAEYTPIVERKPLPGITPLRDRLVPEATADIDVVNGLIEIDATAGLRAIYTKNYGRYLPGVIGLVGVGYLVDDPSTGHYEFGYGNDVGDRLGIELDNGEWYTFIESAGVRYWRNPRSNWIDPLDGTGPSGYTADLSRGVFRAPFGWYGFLSVGFVFVVPDRLRGDRMVLVDRNDQPESGPNIEQPDLPVFAEADGGVLRIGGRQYGVYGRYNPQFRATGTPIVTKTVGDAWEPIASLRVKMNSRWRGVPVSLMGVGMTSTENADWGIAYGGDLTGASWSTPPDVPSEETALEADTSATAVTLNYLAFSDVVVGGSGNRSGANNIDLPDISVPREEVVTLVARAALAGGTTEIRGVLRLLEEF